MRVVKEKKMEKLKVLSLSLACSVAHQIDKLYSEILYAYTRTAQFQANRTQSSPKKGKATLRNSVRLQFPFLFPPAQTH